MRVLDKICRKYLRRRGYVVSRHPSRAGEGDYFIHDYKDGTDRFDYELYRSIQIAGNKTKLQNVYTDRETIEMICEFIRTKPGKLEHGLCHGSRNGSEIPTPKTTPMIPGRRWTPGSDNWRRTEC